MSDMLRILQTFEKDLHYYVKHAPFASLHIDYEKPYVNRLWVEWQGYRLYLHKISNVAAVEDAFLHPHPWPSAMRIVQGSYTMDIGHSQTLDEPSVDMRIHLLRGNTYCMEHPHGWHRVAPLEQPCFTVMVTGIPWGREMPKNPKEEMRGLTPAERAEIKDVIFENYGDEGFIA